jgi:hypothetical protein
VKTIIYLLFNYTANGVLPGGSGTTIRHNTQKYTTHKTTHHAKTNTAHKSYTNNKGHITHNEYNGKKKVKLSL